MRLTYAKMYSILASNVKNRVGFWGLPRPPSREGLLAFGNRSSQLRAFGACTFPKFLKICPPKVTYRFSPLIYTHVNLLKIEIHNKIIALSLMCDLTKYTCHYMIINCIVLTKSAEQ